jgi:hypothetical protein
MLGVNSMENLPFDAAEKLLEIELCDGAPSLRALGGAAWSEIVVASGGAILESRAGRLVDAHVLSESSLFVRDRSMSLLTCGRTDLGRGFEALVERIGLDVIEAVRLSRERDRYPSAARSTFEDDVAAITRVREGTTLESICDGAVLRTFEASSLHSALDFRVFGAGLGTGPSRILRSERGAIAPLLARFADTFAAEFSQVHHFEPSGCSMNLVRGGDAACVHVSPEATADVASIETSSADVGVRLALLEEFERVFQPARISVTLDGRRLMSADEARGRLHQDGNRRSDARVM